MSKTEALEAAARFARDALTGYPYDDAHWRDFCSPAIKALEAALAQPAANGEPYILQAPALAMRNPQKPESRQEVLPAGTEIYTAPDWQLVARLKTPNV